MRTSGGLALTLSICAASTAVTGCTDAIDDEDDLAQTEQDATLFANDKAAYDFFVAKGLTNFQAAGIVGNLDQESGVNPSSVQYGGGPGRGIAQWSVGGRWDSSSPNVLHYASTQGQSATSLNLQLNFIWLELTTVGYGYTQLKATTNVTDAVLVFMDRYEICGTCASSQRITYAKNVLAAYGQAPAYGATYVSQSFPLASAPPLQIHCGETIPAKIVLKNTGSTAWSSATKLGTTGPRDRVSIFAGSDWPSPNRAAQISGSVAPNANGTFSFSFQGPTGADCVPGTYHEHFGLVQEGVTWFSTPAETQIEALLQLLPDDGSTPPPDDGTGSGSDMGSDDPSTTDPANDEVGCNAGGSTSSLLTAFALGALLVPRRRRRNVEARRT